MEVPIDSLRKQHGQIYCSFIKQVDFLHYPIQNPMSTSPSPLTPSPFVSIYPHVQIVLTCSKTWAKFNIFKFPTGMNVLTLRSWLILCTKTVLRHINQSRDLQTPVKLSVKPLWSHWYHSYPRALYWSNSVTCFWWPCLPSKQK